MLIPDFQLKIGRNESGITLFLMQIPGVKAQVILNKAGDEKVTVVITGLRSQRERPVVLLRQFGQFRRL